ncbi:MAG: glycosyltransferase family 2 protein [Spirosomataceae bacterium]
MYAITCSVVAFKNEESQLKSAIESVLSTKLNIKLYLIDNSPSNELENIIIDSRIEYIHNPSNPGFGAAHNIAIKKSLSIGAKYHLVLNPDVRFDTGVMEQIINFMEQSPDVGNLMPKVLYPDGSEQYLCKLLPTPYDWIGRRFNPFKSIVNQRNKMFELRFTGYTNIMEVPYLSGCFMFLRLNAIKEVGLFDENIFMYGEETDLCRRIISKGYKNTFYPKVFIYHEFAKGSHKSLRLTLIGIQSAMYYFNKWGWFFDKERKRINKETLAKLGYE